MTQEEKDLLLKDMCARLPYNVKVDYNGATIDLTRYARSVKLFECKPYLRKIPSMTHEERQEFQEMRMEDYCRFMRFNLQKIMKLVNWCYEHHLDINKLIERGLALEAPEDMYKEE